jgi:hypothetical protein
MKIAAVVIAVLILIGIGVYVYNKEKIGKSSDPAAQQAALTLLVGIPVHWPASKPGYSREQFGKPWTDEVDGVEFGRNGCDTRDDILRRDLSDVVPPSGCGVMSGVLHDPYTGRDIPFNRDEGTDVLVQIDHVVALLSAWQTGAQQWDQAKRTRLAMTRWTCSRLMERRIGRRRPAMLHHGCRATKISGGTTSPEW